MGMSNHLHRIRHDEIFRDLLREVPMNNDENDERDQKEKYAKERT